MDKISKSNKKYLEIIAERICPKVELVPEGGKFDVGELLIVMELLNIYKKGTKGERDMFIRDYDSEPFRFCWEVIEMMNIPFDQYKLMEIMLHIQSIAKVAFAEIGKS